MEASPCKRRQLRVSTLTTSSRSGFPSTRTASRRSTTQVMRPCGNRARKAAATGSAWTTSPTEESLTIAAFMRARGSPPREPLHDERDEVARRMVLRVTDDGHRGTDGTGGGLLGHTARAVIGTLGMNG